MGEALIVRRGGGEKTIKFVKEVVASSGGAGKTSATWTNLDTKKYFYVFQGEIYSASNGGYIMTFIVADGKVIRYEDNQIGNIEYFTITVTANSIKAQGYYSNVTLQYSRLLEMQIV